MKEFVASNSIVRRIWGNPDLILLVLAGAAAEFALNRAVDWLFFTGRIPADPINRLFSTVTYAQQIVFAAQASEAEATIKRINQIHASVERAREAKILEWVHRDVLYLLIDYSERAFELLYQPLEKAEQDELFAVFRRFGELMQIEELPNSYTAWQQDRRRHLERDLTYSHFTRHLFEQYRRHLGEWRYRLLLDVQALIVPVSVRRLLKLNNRNPLRYLIWTYGFVDALGLQRLLRQALLPAQHLTAVEALDRARTNSLN